MSLIIYEVEQLYLRTFGSKPYRVPQGEKSPDPPGFTIDPKYTRTETGSSLIDKDVTGQEVWLPTRFFLLNTKSKVVDQTREAETKQVQEGDLFLPYSVIRISGKKTLVKTPLAERGGTVKEMYSMDDYSISIKGFLIDKQGRQWPEAQIKKLMEIYERNDALHLDNALTNLVLKSPRVVIESLEFPEVEGGRKHVRPFSMTLESDSVFELKL